MSGTDEHDDDKAPPFEETLRRLERWSREPGWQKPEGADYARRQEAIVKAMEEQ